MAIYVSLINSYALGAESPFEAAIDLLNPLAWYRFRDADFATAIEDSSGNNYDLTKQLATATRSAVPTRTTHPGGAYFPAVTYDNWATQGTFYKGVAGLLSGATEYTMLISFRMIAAPSDAVSKMFGVGTENVGETTTNDLVFMRASNNAPTNPHYFKHRSNTGGLIPANYVVTEVLQDGVNRLAIVRYKRSTPIYQLTTSKPGHEALTEESPAATSGTGLDAISKALILNARSETNSGSSTTTGVVIDQIAVFSTDIGATAETNLHSLWSDEVAGAGYYPSMMQFDGSTGYYSKTSVTIANNVFTMVARFQRAPFNGAGVEYIATVYGAATTGRIRAGIWINADDHATADRRGRISVNARNTAGTSICFLASSTVFTDDEPHVVFFEYNATTGAAVFRIDGVNEDNGSFSGRILTTGTMDTGATGAAYVGVRENLDGHFEGPIGHFGYRDAGGLDYADFSNGSLPIAIDEKNWTEWGAQPLFWSHTGQLDNNKGSAGDFTVNGTITMTTGGSP